MKRKERNSKGLLKTGGHKSLNRWNSAFPIPSLWPGYFRNQLSPFWALFPATNFGRSRTPEMPTLREILAWRQRRAPNADCSWMSMDIQMFMDLLKFSLSTWHENLSLPCSSHTESVALLRELPTLRFGRKIMVHEKPNPFLHPHSDACTDQRPQKLQQLTVRITWCHKTLTLLFHCQMPNKTYYIGFPCPSNSSYSLGKKLLERLSFAPI